MDGPSSKGREWLRRGRNHPRSAPAWTGTPSGLKPVAGHVELGQHRPEDGDHHDQGGLADDRTGLQRAAQIGNIGFGLVQGALGAGAAVNGGPGGNGRRSSDPLSRPVGVRRTLPADGEIMLPISFTHDQQLRRLDLTAVTLTLTQQHQLAIAARGYLGEHRGPRPCDRPPGELPGCTLGGQPLGTLVRRVCGPRTGTLHDRVGKEARRALRRRGHR